MITLHKFSLMLVDDSKIECAFKDCPVVKKLMKDFRDLIRDTEKSSHALPQDEVAVLNISRVDSEHSIGIGKPQAAREFEQEHGSAEPSRCAQEDSSCQSGINFHGVVKSFKGSFGRIQCPDLPGEVLLHKKDCDRLPNKDCHVSFRLEHNPKGIPKAIGAKISERVTHGEVVEGLVQAEVDNSLGGVNHSQFSDWLPEARKEFLKSREELPRIIEEHLWKSSVQRQQEVRQHDVHRGVVTTVRGAFGRITCESVEGEILLHKSDCDQKPKRGDEVSFCLTTNEKGFQKAVEVKIQK